MRPLSPDKLTEVRSILNGSPAPCEKTDELIRVLYAIAISFVDQAYGFSSVQLSLSARANRAFSGSDSCEGVQLSAKQNDDETELNLLDSSKNERGDFAI